MEQSAHGGLGGCSGSVCLCVCMCTCGAHSWYSLPTALLRGFNQAGEEHSRNTRMNAHTHVHRRMHADTHMHMHTQAHTHVHTRAHAHTGTQTCTYIGVCSQAPSLAVFTRLSLPTASHRVRCSTFEGRWGPNYGLV